MKSRFKPIRLWPDGRSPFDILAQFNGYRVFQIANISWNYDWMRAARRFITADDFFFVRLGWHHDEKIFTNNLEMLDSIGLGVDQFHVLFNSKAECEVAARLGIPGSHVNSNAFIYEPFYGVDESQPELYDAVYNARLATCKRHHLTRKLDNLALIAGNYRDAERLSIERALPNFKYLNDHRLSACEVSTIINRSRCGIVLSAVEGQNNATTEYMLCGRIVVSTPSLGGRDEWFDENNSIICQADEDSVRNAVGDAVRSEIDRHAIRRKTIERMLVFRKRFLTLLERKLNACGISASDWWKKNFVEKKYNKMKSYNENSDIVEYFNSGNTSRLKGLVNAFKTETK